MRLIWLFVAVIAQSEAFAPEPEPVSEKCPQGCNCTDTSTAVCSTLFLTSFIEPVSSLKIVNPSTHVVLSRGVFHNLGLKTVNVIYIENATIVEIDEMAFAGLTSLRSLSIVGSEILEFPPKVLSSVSSLRSLSLSGSKFNFSTLVCETLEELHLSNSRIVDITENTFNNLPQLIYLNLENSKIRKIHPLAFINLTNLEELLLAKNNLSYLMPNLFENNMELVTLDLSYNPIREFNVNIISYLEKLNLRGCGLSQFNSSFGKNFDLLPELDISENKIESIAKETFAKMTKLKYINLSNNNLRTLDENVFDSNSGLERIVLDNNDIKELPNFTSKGYFETLLFSCNNCNLTKISTETFTYMRALNFLLLSNNSLKELDPQLFDNIPSLRKLDVSYNIIAELKPNTFAKLSQLEELNIAGNLLKQPLDANMFYHNRALRTLDASSCNLKRLWSANTLLFFNMPSIRELIISNNELRSVSPRDLQVLPNLQVLDIRNNPLECSQTLRDTITWLTERDVYPSSAKSVWKTHESLVKDAAAFEEINDKMPNWKELAKEACEDEDYFDNYDNDELEVPTPRVIQSTDDNDIKKYAENSEEYDEDDDYSYSDDLDYNDKNDESNDILHDSDKAFDNVKTEIYLEKLAIESRKYREKKKQEDAYAYLSPTLVFILTAASVLVIAANVMLLILRSRGALVPPRENNLPHFKILQWGTVNKLKKHSGSVYQPLSEEKSATTTPKVNRYQKLPSVHTILE